MNLTDEFYICQECGEFDPETYEDDEGTIRCKQCDGDRFMIVTGRDDE